ncbi:unnamed protein product [Mucor circinelloides]|uniref:Leucine carboxyl methyltransferase 1 n=1 Tax=Mucor circinelloides f. circinelloides (strain 1006PhL) TaxID=1220926 RepID=S2JU67_MUCC1|nr:hypothetical protein HMPREF1544_06877 [Mucor circinelloides 1006PhL]
MNFLDDEVKTSDDIVRGTNDDATVSRLSAVNLGYFQDPFVKLFVKKPTRRSPIINRGTFIRSYAIDSIVSQFLNMPGPKKQIVALGAGFDTRYFNIKAGILNYNGNSLSENLSKYFEIDFSDITMKKAMMIKRRKELSSLMTEADQAKIGRGGMDLLGKDYCLLGGDLRNWSDIANSLLKAGLNIELPTLFLSECVFIYITPEESNTILKWITENMRNAMFTLYEQIKPDDAFGKMMIRNLKSRNIELKGLQAFPDLIHQERRFKDLGWENAKAVDMNTIHDKYLNRSEILRMSKLEILDELEEWHLLSAHYCVAWAVHSADFSQEFNTVQLQPHQQTMNI